MSAQTKNATVLYAGKAFYVKFEDGSQDVKFTYDHIKNAGAAIHEMLVYIAANDVNVLNRDAYKFFESEMPELQKLDENLSVEDELMLEFEMFNVKRRDITDFKGFLKMAGEVRKVVKSGADLNTRKFQQGFTHEIQRSELFKHPAHDNIYKSWGPKTQKEREEAEGGNYTTPGAFPAAVLGY